MKKRIKILLIAVLAIACISCVAFAAACSGEPNYFVLDFENVEGIEYVCDIPSGYEVKEKEEVSFSLNIDSKVIGEPKVRANETELTADENGNYKFTMLEDTKVTVSDTYYIHPYTVKFDKGDCRVTFRGVEGEELTEFSADEGTVVKFTIDISVYHDRTKPFDVSVNSLLIQPVNGVYSFTVINNTTVSVKGLKTAEGFDVRPGCGSGTADDPFLLSEPVDLWCMHVLINDVMSGSRYAAAHYKLIADLDMEGEQLMALGDGTLNGQLSVESVFSGTFDGGGHTVSNYYMSETQFDDSYNDVIISYIGFFGRVVAGVGSPSVEIKNLNLKDFTIYVDGSKIGGTYYAGGLVGFGYGVNITNCTVEGTITANGPAYNDLRLSTGTVGGVAGYITSSYGSEEIKYNSSIVATGSDVEITSETGIMFAAGGLAGVLASSDDKATSYILNSYALNNVSGAIYTGGLVGNLGSYTTVKNSYFAGEYADAISRVQNSTSFGTYAHAYGGGIAGYMYYDSVISDCFTSGDAGASSVSGGNFAHSGEISGYLEAAGTYLIESSASAVLNTHSGNAGTLTEQYALNTLNWVADDWSFVSGSLPVPKGTTEGEFTLTINYKGNQVDGSNVKNITLSGSRNMAQLYDDGSVEQFVQSGNLQSYGYYFDEELTQKVIFGFVPSGNVTLYAGFANYNYVAGRYYIRGNTNGAYLDLNVDGTLLYRSGAQNHTTYYTYDGEKITLVENVAFEVVERMQVSETSYYDSSIYFCAIATVQPDGTIRMVNIADSYTGPALTDSSQYYTSSNPLTAVKELDNFVYGTYYAGDVQYTFNTDGTGRFGYTEFTYTVNGTQLTTNIGGAMNRGEISDDGYVARLGITELSKYDPFLGTWENSASSHKQYTFDGKGGYTYEYNEFVKVEKDGEKEGEKIIETVSRTLESYSGTYTIDENGILKLDDRVETLSFDENGYLTVNHGAYTETYYMENSFVGEWRFFNTDEPVSVTFNGIGNAGYGTGTVVYGTGTYESDFQYQAYVLISGTDGETRTAGVLIYTQDTLIANLTYNVEDNTLRGSMYSFYYGRSRDGVIFCLYDDFRGKWISDEFGIIEFNGLGNYDMGGGSSGIIRTRGEVLINGDYAGAYVLEGYNLKGSFVYDGKVYSIEYDVQNGLIKVTESDRNFNLIELDSLYNISFIGDDGNKYVFNGGGNLPNGGKLTVNDEERYSYKITADEQIDIYGLDGGAKIGGFVLSETDNAYILTVDGNPVKLTYDNLFTGSWVVGGAEEGVLEIGKVGVDKTATGTYLGAQVTFTFDSENEILSFTADNVRYYVHSFTGQGAIELKISNSLTDTNNALICIEESRVSELKGVYVASANKTLYIDGMNTSLFGRGTAVLKDGDSEKQFTYRLEGEKIILSCTNEDGTKENLALLPTELSTEGAYINGSTAYELVVPDNLFDVRVWDTNRTAQYRFDGLGTVTATAGSSVTTYTYVIETYNETTKEYTLTLTDAAGKKYKASFANTGTGRITVTSLEETGEETAK